MKTYNTVVSYPKNGNRIPRAKNVLFFKVISGVRKGIKINADTVIAASTEYDIDISTQHLRDYGFSSFYMEGQDPDSGNGKTLEMCCYRHISHTQQYSTPKDLEVVSTAKIRKMTT